MIRNIRKGNRVRITCIYCRRDYWTDIRSRWVEDFYFCTPMCAQAEFDKWRFLEKSDGSARTALNIPKHV